MGEVAFGGLLGEEFDGVGELGEEGVVGVGVGVLVVGEIVFGLVGKIVFEVVAFVFEVVGEIVFEVVLKIVFAVVFTIVFEVFELVVVDEFEVGGGGGVEERGGGGGVGQGEGCGGFGCALGFGEGRGRVDFAEEVGDSAGCLGVFAEAVLVGGGGVVGEDEDGVEQFEVALERGFEEVGRSAAEHGADEGDGLAGGGLGEECREGEEGEPEAGGDLVKGLVCVEVVIKDEVEVGIGRCLSGIHGGSVRVQVGVSRCLFGFLGEGDRGGKQQSSKQQSSK